MIIFVTKIGTAKVLHLFPETREEQEAFRDFYEITKPCTAEFKHDPAFAYPHIKIKMEVL